MGELVYVGNRVIPGIPARNLTAEEVDQHGGEKVLIETKLYEKPAKKEVKNG